MISTEPFKNTHAPYMIVAERNQELNSSCVLRTYAVCRAVPSIATTSITRGAATRSKVSRWARRSAGSECGIPAARAVVLSG
jgi:hypothetical protein